jgi:polyisoprenoid-binding protein YceI
VASIDDNAERRVMMQPRIGTGPLRAAAAAVVLAMAAVSSVNAEPRRFVIDPAHTTIAFLVSHIGYERVLGLFQEVEGEFVYDEATRELESGSVTIEADSLYSNHEARDEHVRGEDFLNAGDYSEIRFQATGYEPTGEHTGKLHGELTLLGETRPVTLDLTINKIGPYPEIMPSQPYVLGASARGSVMRSDFGMTYGVENGLVGDKVEFIIEFEAQRQPQ